MADALAVRAFDTCEMRALLFWGKAGLVRASPGRCVARLGLVLCMSWCVQQS
jgi:hypothetical protein